MTGAIQVTSETGQPRLVPNFLRGSLNLAYSDLNCVDPNTLQSGMPLRCVSYRTCGSAEELEKKARLAGSVQAVKDSAVRYAGSRQRERLARLNPNPADSDPEIIQID